MLFDNAFITNVIPQAYVLNAGEPIDASFSLDTRTLKAGEIFVAVRGKNEDGHNFVHEEIEKGASGLIIAQDMKKSIAQIDQKILQSKWIIAVPDTTAALIELATAWRSTFTYPVIGITGSIGKTTTKEMIANICAEHGMNYLASFGNFNTKYGVALTLLKMRAEHQVAIVEMGINKRGEMATLAAMAKPTYGLITSIGHCHMEGLGSIGDIAAEKRDIFKYFKEDSIGIVNGDQPLISQVAYSHPVVKFGLKTTNQVQARKVNYSNDQIRCILKLYGDRVSVTLPKNHAGIISNALAAASVACLLDIPTETIIKGLCKPVTLHGRFERRALKNGKGVLINDSYNASPESMKAALLSFQSIKTDACKIAILGDMLELGVNAPFWHRQLGRFLRKAPSVKRVILVGSMVEWTQKTIPLNLKVEIVSSWHDALDLIKPSLDKETLLLIKGSHRVGLENIANSLT